jgi:NADH-quinone oxidoreductase subunit G
VERILANIDTDHGDHTVMLPRHGLLLSIAGIEQADACLIIGSNPRWEAPLVNARILKRTHQGRFKVAVIGEHLDLTYKYEHLGEGAETLQALAEGRHPFFETLQKAERPMLILGQGARFGASRQPTAGSG